MNTSLYKSILRPLLFQVDSERIHHFCMDAARFAELPGISLAVEAFFSLHDERLHTECFGLHFDSPIGLAAGFDKDCRVPYFFRLLGFSFIEVGSVTAQAQEGNPLPRIFRLPEDEALINRMGFPSCGVEALLPRLQKAMQQKGRALLGVNIGKTKIVPIDDALSDYLASFTRVQQFADYFVLNVSSPNTPELRKLQEKERLTALLQGIQAANTNRKPLLVKVAPDLSFPELDEVLQCCLHAKASGIIATNTTFERPHVTNTLQEVGGLSGAPLFEKAKSFVQYISQATEGKLPIIGVGGISRAEQVIEMLQAGASLVQIYTGLIYEGPSIVKNMKRELLKRMERDGVKSIREYNGR